MNDKNMMEPTLFYLYRELKLALKKFRKQAFHRRNLRYFLYYAVANFAILILYSLYESFQSVNLYLKPVTSPAVEGSWLLFGFAVVLLPITLLLEELGFRLLPMLFIRDVFHLNSITISVKDERGIREIHHSPARLWIYRHWKGIFIVVSAVWAGLLHQINVVNSDALGALIYFGVQAFSGICFAWIYAHRGLGAAWVVHISWDYLIVFLNLIMFSL